MKNIQRPVKFLLLFSSLILFFVLIMQPLAVFQYHKYIDFLFPDGAIAIKERNLLLLFQGLMLLVIVPVYILTFLFSWKYQANNPKGKYDPHLIDHLGAECIWWGLPLVLTVIICGITWVKTHELDPYKPLVSDVKPITIQAIALQWKWLFLYPEEKIASLNFLQIPKEVPIHFEVTADAPMNSLWIPRLGGQIYAMPNAKTELNLIANATGDFRGSSANISGVGFSGMHFTARSSTLEEYQSWIDSIKKSAPSLTFDQYLELAKPSQNMKPSSYQLQEGHLFERIIDQYMEKK